MSLRNWILGAALASLAGSCASHHVHTLDEPARERVVFGGGIGRRIAAQSPHVIHRDGVAIAQVELVSRSPQRTSFLYAFDWFDEAGLEVGERGYDWREGTLLSGEVQSLAATAPLVSAVDFRLRVRPR